MRPPDFVAILLGEMPPDQIVDRELNRLFRCHSNELRQNTRVEPFETFVFDHLLRTVDGILVKHLANALASLVLHSCLHQIDGIHGESTEGTRNASKPKMMDRL